MHIHVHVVVNSLISGAFRYGLTYANEVETKEKSKLPEIKNYIVTTSYMLQVKIKFRLKFLNLG